MDRMTLCKFKRKIIILEGEFQTPGVETIETTILNKLNEINWKNYFFIKKTPTVTMSCEYINDLMFTYNNLKNTPQGMHQVLHQDLITIEKLNLIGVKHGSPLSNLVFSKNSILAYTLTCLGIEDDIALEISKNYPSLKRLKVEMEKEKNLFLNLLGFEKNEMLFQFLISEKY
jgi:hypothetical protein